MNVDKNFLAIIIPCSRIEYLNEALFSLANQSCKNFTVYIGDDATQFDVEGIINRYKTSIDIHYYRFNENLGKKDLIAQWSRCIDLSDNEPWIWLFSDDDIADSECVASFYSNMEKVGEKFDVFRFNTLIIDGDKHVKRICPPNPQFEQAIVFTYHRLLSERYSFVPDHIFSRKIYQGKGGFVKFPTAWGSDDATWIEFAGEKGMYTICGPYIRWRMSNNISSVNITNRNKKMLANVQYLKWLKVKFNNKKYEELNLDDKVILQLSKNWIVNQWINQSSGEIIWNVRYWANLLNEIFEDGLISNIRRMLRINRKILKKRLSIFH